MPFSEEELCTLSEQYGVTPSLTPPDTQFDWHICRYFAFYDVPNAWVGYLQGEPIIALREFERALDDYPGAWQIYRTPPFTVDDLFENQFAHFKQQEFLREFPVSTLRFHRDRPRSEQRHLYFAWFRMVADSIR